MAKSFSFGASASPKERKRVTPEYSGNAELPPNFRPGQGQFSFGAGAVNPDAGVGGSPTAGGGDIGALIAAILGAQAPAAPDFAGLLQQLHANKIDSVEEGNRRSQLPSYHPQSAGPWSGENPYFKPFNITPEQKAQSQGLTAENQWHSGITPQSYAFGPVTQGRNPGTTIGYPTEYASSFMGNSRDVLGADGLATGRTASNGYGFGSSSFPVPQPPTGSRRVMDDRKRYRR